MSHIQRHMYIEHLDTEYVGPTNICISGVHQQSFIEVDEEGTEAAGATVVVIQMMECV